MSAKPMSPLRWFVAIAVLVLIFATLISKRNQPPATPPVKPVAETAISVPDIDPELDPIPPLTTLQSIDRDKAPARRSLDLQHWTTAEGARVYFMQASELPMLDLQLLFAAGASRDAELPGLATLVNGMLNEGADGMDSGEIAAGFESLGAEFENSSHRDMALASVRSLTAADKLDPALALFTRVISQPDFPENAYQRLRNQLLAGLQFRLQNPSAQASEAFWASLYPNHPYGSLPQGQADSLAEITPAHLRTFHQQYYAAGNAVISLVGDIDRQQAERIAARVSQALPAGPAAPAVSDPEPIVASREHVDFNSQQTHIMVGQHGVSRRAEDYPALYVGNQILGSGFGSRLMEEIRETRGLSYSVSSSFSPMQATGPFVINMQTRSDQVEQALEVINSTLDTFISEGPTEAELIRSKRQIMGQFPLSTASNSAIVSQLGMIGFYNLPLNHLQLFLDQVEKLTVAEVREAFQRHLSAEQRFTLTVGQPLIEAADQSPADASANPAAEAPEA
ncbi:pitrilysin family protein [Halopseudomonas pelagia]|uniref:M16 family metallopeptidase n=1 Tax=Halopseudomonas pelagia TaxID=553151 RepID=UPI0030DD48CD|tara:strand:+ start:89205 stop:90734 length:1530 start_codon:yes stop_codon:yes gene_type:complete